MTINDLISEPLSRSLRIFAFDPSLAAQFDTAGIGEITIGITALITDVRAWAETQKGWDHPLKAIKNALLKKASGRVFQTDTDASQMEMVAGGSKADWANFQSRVMGEPLYFDYKTTT